jgi:hypothetical protein
MNLESLNYVVSIGAIILAPLITWVVTISTHGVKMETLEKQVEEIKQKADAQMVQYQEILSRLSRIEGKLEGKNHN